MSRSVISPAKKTFRIKVNVFFLEVEFEWQRRLGNSSECGVIAGDPTPYVTSRVRSSDDAEPTEWMKSPFAFVAIFTSVLLLLGLAFRVISILAK